MNPGRIQSVPDPAPNRAGTLSQAGALGDMAGAALRDRRVVLATFHRLRATLARSEPASAAKPGVAEVFYALAKALRDFGLLSDAVDAYDAAVALAPGRIDFHCGRAELVRF